MSKHPIYDSAYYQTGNYHNYDGLEYRLYHLAKYLALGLTYKITWRVKSILDVGCATGMSVWVFRKLLGLEAYGIDVSPYAIAQSIQGSQRYLSCADLTNASVAFPRRHFDLVVSYDTFEHFPMESLPIVLHNIFSVCEKAILEIYVLDEPVAQLHNVLRKSHPDHFCEHTSAWWIDTFSQLGYISTHLPISRPGCLLVRPRFPQSQATLQDL